MLEQRQLAVEVRHPALVAADEPPQRREDLGLPDLHRLLGARHEVVDGVHVLAGLGQRVEHRLGFVDQLGDLLRHQRRVLDVRVDEVPFREDGGLERGKQPVDPLVDEAAGALVVAVTAAAV